MKKFIYLLLLLLPFGLTSCHDDDNDLPNVDFNVTFDDTTINSDGVIYVVQGESFAIEGITVTNREPGKGAMITAANYYWDGYFLGTSVVDPYGFEIETSETTPVADHSLQISCPLFAVDKEMSTALLTFTVRVVASESDLPTPAPGDANQTRVVTPSLTK